MVPTSALPAATVAPTPEPAEVTATPDMSGEAAGENGDEITREDVLGDGISRIGGQPV